jgi:hypothetical protein
MESENVATAEWRKMAKLENAPGKRAGVFLLRSFMKADDRCKEVG